MSRHALRITIVLGILITLVGGTGIFAVLTDRATAGANSVGTGSQPKAADITIADGDGIIGRIPFGCGTFQDNLETAQFTVESIQPGYSDAAELCVRNAGAAPVALTMGESQLADHDTGCTGDEAVAGDATCGVDGQLAPQAGELSPLLSVTLWTIDCSGDSPPINNGIWTLDELANGSIVITDSAAPLAPGAIVCLRIDLSYSPSALDAQLAQSDTATWRFKFDASAT